MAVPRVFISHASEDDPFVSKLRLALEAYRVPVWADSRNLGGGAMLVPEISEAIEHAARFMVVLSPHTVRSSWVRREIRKALDVEEQRANEGYRVIPLLLPGVTPKEVADWCAEDLLPRETQDRVAISVDLEPGGLTESLADILAALGYSLPDDRQPAPVMPTAPVSELLLEFTGFCFQNGNGRRACATAILRYRPADAGKEIETAAFEFTAPLGVIEAGDLQWYLEKSFLWPGAIFKARADRIEAQLPRWGNALYQEVVKNEAARDLLAAWRNTAADADRRISVLAAGAAPQEAVGSEDSMARSAANQVLGLPWELLHDGKGYLFHGRRPVRVRRLLPGAGLTPAAGARSPVRILLVSPRPETDRIPYIDHRSGARPLVEAVEDLGELVTITILNPPTFQALQETLRSGDRGKPFDVVHFDGYGLYDEQAGLSGLYFEDANDADKAETRGAHLVRAAELAVVMRDYHIPLVFIQAFSTDPTTGAEPSLAAGLLAGGVASVVALTHNVLMETARRFNTGFYRELARGARVGTAMLAGQQALHTDPYRGRIPGAGDLRLQDWFVPVLYQQEQDPRLMTQLPSELARLLESTRRRLNLGQLPTAPPHGFSGRSRELLLLERVLLAPAPPELSYAVVVGPGGQGKTALAVELARWLAETRRFGRVAFVAFEEYTDARSLLDSIGRQLLPEGDLYSVAEYRDIGAARLPLERALRQSPALIVLDNAEVALPGGLGQTSSGKPSSFAEIAALCQQLLRAHPATRLLFTSRETLAAPFHHHRCELRLQRLAQSDAIELVRRILRQEGLEPGLDDSGNISEEVVDLVEAAGCHARALTLMAHEAARHGVRNTIANLRRTMDEMDRSYSGDRELSLYESVELSLSRLSAEMRKQVTSLAAFHTVASLDVLGTMLADVEVARRIADALIEVGLVEEADYGDLRLDPALSQYLLAGMTEAEREETQSRWALAAAMQAGFLEEQRWNDSQIAAKRTRVQLPNLLALLDWMSRHAAAEGIVGTACTLEKLISPLGLPRTLAAVTAARERAARDLAEWGHARFLAEGEAVERLIERGEHSAAFAAAKQLLKTSLEAGEHAYPGAVNDIPLAYLRLGRVLGDMGKIEFAVPMLAEACRRLDALAADAPAAEDMAYVARTEFADCLVKLERLEESSSIYEAAIVRANSRQAKRTGAVNKYKLGVVRKAQGRYEDAVRMLFEAKAVFEEMAEPKSVANAWVEIGDALQQTDRLDQAEEAYRQALVLCVQHNQAVAEGRALQALGSLVAQRGALDEATTLYRRAADRFADLGDDKVETLVRGTLAAVLGKQRRYDEARTELNRAFSCAMAVQPPFEPWKPAMLIHDLENSVGNPQPAADARDVAIKLYVAYRSSGGTSQNPRAELFARVLRVLRKKRAERRPLASLNRLTQRARGRGRLAAPSDDLAALRAQLTAAEISTEGRAHGESLVAKLQAILSGERDPALAQDPALDYLDAGELHVLLEYLAK
jgi:tetratricopeptide (TPR) repeat protein